MAGIIKSLSVSEGTTVTAAAANGSATPTTAGRVTSYFPTIQSSVKAASANYTITTTDGYQLIDVTTASSAITITLPSASTDTGRRIAIKKTDSGTGSVAISGTINGSSSNNTILKQYGIAEVISDGSGWTWINDVYEYGTFSGALVAASGGAMTVSSASYNFRRIGRVVYIEIVIVDITTSGKSGTITITGLPYAAKSTDSGCFGSLYARVTTVASGVNLTAGVTASSTTLRPTWNKTGDANNIGMVVADLANATQSDLSFSGFYFID